MCRSKKSSRTATCGKFCVLVRVHQNLNLEEINLSLVSLGAQGHLNKTKRFTFEDLIHLITLSTTFQNNRQVCVDLFIYKILIIFISSDRTFYYSDTWRLFFRWPFGQPRLDVIHCCGNTCSQQVKPKEMRTKSIKKYSCIQIQHIQNNWGKKYIYNNIIQRRAAKNNCKKLQKKFK